jgi:hypothetical protein
MTHRHPIAGVLAAAAALAALLAVPADARAETPQGAEAAAAGQQPDPQQPDPLGWHTGERTGVTRLRADLLQRSGGEWVLVNLRPLAIGTAEAPAAAEGEAVPVFALHPGVRATLDEYERSFERRDADRLATVLLMAPSERARVQRLFNQASAISLSVEAVAIEFRDDRASVAFDQRMVTSTRPRLARAEAWREQRALFAHDACGNWGGITEAD